MAHPQIDVVEASLAQLSARLPDTPVDSVLLSRLILFLGRDLATMLDTHIRPVGLAEAEFRVLTALFAQADGVAHPSDLCARAAQSPANMSRISDALVSRDLITRVLSKQDRRRMVLRITEKGEELVRLLLPTLFSALRDMFVDFSVAEQQALISQLKRLVAKLDKVLAPAEAEPSA
jgi:DNA-binding MarR family transcriptional regulator